MDAHDCHRAGGIECGQGGWHDVADRREHDGGIRFLGRGVVGVAGGGGAEFQGESAGLFGAGHDVYGRALGERDLCGQMRGRAEPVDAQPAAGRQVGA